MSAKFLSFSQSTVPVELPEHRDWFMKFGERSCGLVSIALASGLPHELVYKEASLVVLPSKWQSQGLWPHEMRKILDRLRVRYINHEDRLTSFWSPRLNRYDNPTFVYLTETQFKRSDACDKSKTYIVCNKDHAWVIKNGVTLDPVWFVSNKQNSKRRITHVIELI